MIVCPNCKKSLPEPKVPGPVRCICGTRIENNKEYSNFKMENIGKFDFLRKETESRKHWRKLHRYAVEYKDNWTKGRAIKWFSSWEDGIPNINCSCRKNWFLHTKSLPPDFTSAQAFFKWTVEIHNIVNKNLSKDQFSYKEAVELYGF